MECPRTGRGLLSLHLGEMFHSQIFPSPPIYLIGMLLERSLQMENNFNPSNGLEVTIPSHMTVCVHPYLQSLWMTTLMTWSALTSVHENTTNLDYSLPLIGLCSNALIWSSDLHTGMNQHLLANMATQHLYNTPPPQRIPTSII